MQGLSLMPTLQVKKISRQGSTNSTGSNEGSSRFESPNYSNFFIVVNTSVRFSPQSPYLETF